MRRRIAALALLVLAAGCSHPRAVPGSTVIRLRTSDGEVAVLARVADTSASRQRGLAGVRDLGADRGMVFLFDHPIRATFWMKDTLIPLSVAFWAPDGRIVAIEGMSPCRSDPCPSYRAPAPVAGALEVNRGFFREEGVKVGDRVELGHD